MKDDAPALGAGAGRNSSRHFSKYPHALHDALTSLSSQGKNLSGACYLILLTIIRYTHGWQREWWRASTRDFVETTSLSKRTVETSLPYLLSLELVDRRPLKNSFEYKVSTPETPQESAVKHPTSPGQFDGSETPQESAVKTPQKSVPPKAKKHRPERSNLGSIDKIDSKRPAQGEKTSGERSTASEASDDEQARAPQDPKPLLEVNTYLSLDEALTHEPDTLERRVLSDEFDGVPGRRHDGVQLTNLGPWLRRVVDRSDTDTLTAWEVRCPHIPLPVFGAVAVQTPCSSSPSQLAA